MKKIIFLLFLISLSKLYAFFPAEKNFSDRYQYSMFRSWIRKNKIKSDGIAAFYGKKIKIKYKDRKVIYLLNKGKISRQMEDIFAEQNYELNEIYINIAEMLYRINCADTFFLYDFLDKNKAIFSYKNFKADKAVLEFTKVYEHEIFIPKKININSKISIISSKNDTLIVYFREYKNYIRYRLPKKKLLKKKKVKYKNESDIFEFIAKNYRKKFHLEILNNKIFSSDKFIFEDFKDYTIEKKGNFYRLSLPSRFNRFYANLEVVLKKKKNSVAYSPNYKYDIKNKTLVFPWGESIDFSILSYSEIKSVVPALVQLLFEHRALGKRMFNFLLINDAIPSTLVLKENSKKHLLEFQSYSSLLKMLNHYFLGDNVYFTVDKIKRVNGFLEIFADLYVNKKDSNEKVLAQVRFQLDKKNKMKYIMFFLNTYKSERTNENL